MKDIHKSIVIPSSEERLGAESLPIRSRPRSKWGDRHKAFRPTGAIYGMGGRLAGWIRWQLVLWFLFLLPVAALEPAWAEIKPPDPPLQTIIARMAQARAENRAQFRRYVVTRDYNFYGKEKNKSKSQVIADVSFVPPDSKAYIIQQTNGSSLGEKVVRRMLECESEIARNHLASELSEDNYDFVCHGEETRDGQSCYVLELLPKRKERNLLHARIWVDASTYMVRRMEGEPAKSPSWWLRDVRITFLYGNVGGMWLQTSSASTVNVRILGQYTMVSSDVKYRIGELEAAELPFAGALTSKVERIALASVDPSQEEWFVRKENNLWNSIKLFNWRLCKDGMILPRKGYCQRGLNIRLRQQLYWNT